MRALAAPGYGPLETLRAIDAPLPEPRRGELRVRVACSALNPADYKVVLGTMKFLHARNTPLVVGYDFSGTVDAVGPSTSAFSVGDEVFGFLPYGPGNTRGAFAEMLIARHDEVARKPASVSHAQAAAAATTGLTAIQALRDLGRLARGGRVAITGASGGVGSIAVPIAKRLGATVLAVGSGKGLELAQRLGADEVWDRTKGGVPVGRARHDLDVVFDAAASYRWGQWRPAIKAGGAFVTTLPTLGFVVDKLGSLFSRTRVHVVMVKSRPADLALLGGWLVEGLEVPLASTVPVRGVAAALARLEQGSAGGRVAVEVAGGF